MKYKSLTIADISVGIGNIGELLNDILKSDLKYLNNSEICITLPDNQAQLHLNRYL